MDNNFIKLASIDVGQHVEKKANLSYLSWAWAVDQLMRVDPSANWEFHDPKMFGDTMMVSCTVTAFGKPVTMHLPVMDHRNKAIHLPDAFEVNKNMMRCLVKAIACHGLGLYIYAGEDLPLDDGKPEPKPAPRHSPTQGAADELPEDQRVYLRDMAMELIGMVKGGHPRQAYERVIADRLDDVQHTALWSLLDSSTRSAIKAAKVAA